MLDRFERERALGPEVKVRLRYWPLRHSKRRTYPDGAEEHEDAHYYDGPDFGGTSTDAGLEQIDAFGEVHQVRACGSDNVSHGSVQVHGPLCAM